MSKMFKNQKYITRGIQAILPIEIQLLLWNMIDVMEIDEKDYLQVFKFKIIDREKKIVEIEHSQEIPEYSKKITIKMELNEDETTVFCIDDRSHSTMLLAEEY